MNSKVFHGEDSEKKERSIYNTEGAKMIHADLNKRSKKKKMGGRRKPNLMTGCLFYVRITCDANGMVSGNEAEGQYKRNKT